MPEEIHFENRRISNFKGLVILTLDRVIRHTVVHHSSTSTYVPNFIGIGKTFCGWTDVRTDIWPMLLGRLFRVDLKTERCDVKMTKRLLTWSMLPLNWSRMISNSFRAWHWESSPTSVDSRTCHITIIIISYTPDCGSHWTAFTDFLPLCIMF